MSRKQKLELTWIGKDEALRPETRILVVEPSLSHHAARRDKSDIFDNRLIQGDNLLALKAIEQELGGGVQCVYIDPPYNTGSAFEHYDDGLEHSLWLSLMRDRLIILRNLLLDTGSIWINIDDNEGHYMKVLCDEVFGRKNFVSTIVWQKKYAPKADTKFISSSHDFLLVFAKNIEHLTLNRLPKDERQTARYTNRDRDPRGPWKGGDVLRNEVRDYAVFPVRLPSGREVMPPPGTSWRYTKDRFAELVADNRIWFGVDGDSRPALKRFLTEVVDTISPQSIWLHEDAGHNDEAKKESKALFGDRLFSTPKPERLIGRILTIATSPGDIVLDSFAGSGTTGAVAHKMGRRWVMIELGEHALTHIVPRLRGVIDGSDKGGITEAVAWTGGGGFRFFRLAPSLLERDRWGNWVISRDYNATMLTEAMCVHMGFTYAPSQNPLEYWNHGFSSERDFICVTTQALTHSMLKALSHDVGPERHLLICCKAFSGKTDEFTNLSVRRIPQAVLANCEWGQDDYSLRIARLPKTERGTDDQPAIKEVAPAKRERRKSATAAQDLFSGPAEAEA